MRARWVVILATVLLVPLVGTPPALSYAANPAQAQIGPIRYTETAGVQDPVYGAALIASSDPYASNPVTSDDTLVMTLSTFPTAATVVWLRKANAVFPAAGATADDSLAAADLSTAPTSLSSQTWFTLTPGSSTDDTLVQTFIAVNAPGTYTGTIGIYEGSAASLGSAELIQSISFTFTTAGAPSRMVIDHASRRLRTFSALICLSGENP